LPVDAPDIITIALLVVLEGLLSADNALVMAIMVLGLPRREHHKALRYGLIGGFAFRIAATLLAVYLIRIAWVKLLGGLYLLYLTYTHFGGHGGAAADRLRPPRATPWLGMSAFWATVVRVELINLAFSIDSILVAVAMSPKTWVVITGGILGIVAMRLVVGQLLVLVQRYPALVDGAFVIIAWIGGKLCLDYLYDAHVVAFEIPHEVSIGVVVGIFLVAFVYARFQGPATDVDPLTERAEKVLADEDRLIDSVDGDVTK
jgi:YkoY family integral membrane protein